jgi:hypothetical protein
MTNNYFDKEEQKKRITKWVIAIAVLLLVGYREYNLYREKEAILEYNTKVYNKFLEIQKDYKFLKRNVRGFESSRWDEVVPSVQDMTQVLGYDLAEFDLLLQTAPVSGTRKKVEDE